MILNTLINTSINKKLISSKEISVKCGQIKGDRNEFYQNFKEFSIIYHFFFKKRKNYFCSHE